MSQPRMSVPGGTYLITRTTVMSIFLLAPNRAVNQIMEYALAWALRGRGILFHGISIESNHYHLVVTDLEGRLSEFMQEFNRCAARALIDYYRKRSPAKRLDALWSAESFCATLLVTTSAMLDKLVYTFVNPVKDGLVHDYRKWPGFNTRPSDWRNGTRTVERPPYYFKNTPKCLTYEVVPPPQLEGKLEQQIADLEHHIRDAQEQARVSVAAEGRRFMGIKAVMRTDPFAAPSAPRPRGTIQPQMAAGGDGEALRAGLTALKLFRTAYREAWKAFRRGLDVVFPGGTLQMRRRFRVRCEALDASCWCQLAPS